MYGPNSKFYTLDGETIDNKGLPKIGMSTTVNHYRVPRIVYDCYRADDPSLDRFPNVTELWLSPKCDIDGILKTLGNITLSTQWQGDFFEWNCTVFIPDSLYPNGPTYTGHPAPGCRVMLYSGDDVYAAVQKGASASEKKFWAADGTGAYYNNALAKTVVGKGNGYDTYAISKDTYIAAKQDGWATGQLSDWAVEAMGFMNVLGLISGTTLSPDGTCTIEQAIAVASRSLYADRTGWYQENESGGDWLVYGTRVWVYYKNGEACYRDPEGFELTGVTFSKGLRPIKDR